MSVRSLADLHLTGRPLVHGCLAALLLIGTGCSAKPILVRAYRGEPRDLNAVAVVRPIDDETVFGRGGRTSIEKVDGVPLDAAQIVRYEVHVLPGPHAIEVGFSAGGFESTANLHLLVNAAAGYVYEVHSLALDAESFWEAISPTLRWTAWIVDTKTGEVVAGRRPH